MHMDEQTAQMVFAINETEAQRLVQTYRHTYAHIKRRWEEIDKMLHRPVDCDMEFHPVSFHIRGPWFHIRLPSGMFMRREKGFLWYGMVTENVIQALARIVTFGHALVMHRLGYKVALFVHDEIVLVVPENEAEQAKQRMEAVMRRPPDWAKGLPLDCEVNIGRTYAEAK